MNLVSEVILYIKFDFSQNSRRRQIIKCKTKKKETQLALVCTIEIMFLNSINPSPKWRQQI